MLTETKITESAAPAVSRGETETWADRVPENCESSFLLDWLAGGEACQRNIQGFSFKFENLSPLFPTAPVISKRFPGVTLLIPTYPVVPETKIRFAPAVLSVKQKFPEPGASFTPSEYKVQL